MADSNKPAIMTCSPVAPVSPRLPNCMLRRWQVIAIIVCSTVASVSSRLLLCRLLRWQIIVTTACFAIAPVSPRLLLYLLPRWRIIAMNTCSPAAPVSNFHPLRLTSIHRSTVYLLLERARQQQMLSLACSLPQAAPLQEHQKLIRPIISALII